MREIDYGIYDKETGLLVEPFSDSLVRKMTEIENESLAEVHRKIKESLNGVLYFVNLQGKLSAIAKDCRLKTPGEYFSDFDDALEYSKSILKKD